jgi:hypothetical protein
MSDFKNQLIQWSKKNMPTKQQLSKPKKDKELSKRDFEELMGKYRPTYSRRNGAIRQR